MIPPYNKQYYTQGWRDTQPTRWNPSQQQQNQNRQQHTYTPPQNQQNQRHQPPHLRPNPPMNPPPSSVDETPRTYQQESRELKEAHKRIEAHLNDLTELLDKFASQMALAEIESDSEDKYEDAEEEEVTEEDEEEETTEIIKEATKKK
ncbi:hypothetical protein PIB30_089411 [Stylosanthes scabra]|uniref:Uncharacterized protein n=1 Tax=Stylosanthes scabra TaxID=79078 RepID=A0ABU6YUA4_9FABA|nr:hypothetical protein [Stylosanthes scabra]